MEQIVKITIIGHRLKNGDRYDEVIGITGYDDSDSPYKIGDKINYRTKQELIEDDKKYKASLKRVKVFLAKYGMCGNKPKERKK